ncbi:MAG: hypothetical protein R2838_11890 [Caldilineaceae bacterium]
MLTNLNTLMAQGNGQGAPVKLPNVTVEFPWSRRPDAGCFPV